MTPKLKAKELVYKYLNEMRLPSDCEGCMQCVDRCENMVAVAKKYSSIAVDEILAQNISTPDDYGASWTYWMQVKQEIEKL